MTSLEKARSAISRLISPASAKAAISDAVRVARKSETKRSAPGRNPASLANLQRNGRKRGSRNRKRAAPDRVRLAAESGAVGAVKTLRAIADDPDQPGGVRVRAAVALLDRAVGRAPLPVPGSSEQSGGEVAAMLRNAMAAAIAEGPPDD